MTSKKGTYTKPSGQKVSSMNYSSGNVIYKDSSNMLGFGDSNAIFKIGNKKYQIDVNKARTVDYGDLNFEGGLKTANNKKRIGDTFSGPAPYGGRKIIDVNGKLGIQLDNGKKYTLDSIMKYGK